MAAYGSEYRMNSAIETIKVEKSRLIARLQQNLIKHKADYEEAVVGFKSARLKALTKLEETTSAGVDKGLDFGKSEKNAIFKAYSAYSNLPVPKDHSQAYEQALGLMEWSLDDEIEISIGDFERFINDNWDWKGRFNETVTSYKNS